MFAEMVFGVFVMLLATRIWTGFAFKYRREKEPPTLLYWILGIGHGVSLGWNMSRFLANTFQDHANHAPYFIKAGNVKMLIVTKPEHIRRILRDSHELSTDSNLFLLYETMLGASKSILAFYKDDKTLSQKQQASSYVHKDIFKQHLFGPSLVSLSERFRSAFQQHMTAAYRAGTFTKGWMAVPGLYDFMEDLVTRAVMETVCGTMILAGYPEEVLDNKPGFVKDFFTLADAFEPFMKRIPRMFMRKEHEARSRLLDHFKKWGQLVEERKRNTDAKINLEWDAALGSHLLQGRGRALSELPLDEDARATEMLSLTLGALGNVVPVSFWCVFEALKDLNIKEELCAVIRRQRNGGNDYDVSKLSCTPLMQSMHAEVTRLRNTITFSRYVEKEAFELDDQYTVPKDTAIMIMSHQMGLTTESWEAARPEAVEKPLERFWAQRYLVTEVKEGEAIEKFTTSRLTTCHLPFGGGSHKCPGRHFAKNIGAAVMAVLLDEYELELLDPVAAVEATPVVGEMCFGIMKPTAKVAARLRKRSG